MRYAYPRLRWLTSAAAQDLVLASALVVVLAARPAAPIALSLAIAIPLVLAWGVVTIHFPTAVQVDPADIAFFGYGRVHRYAWRDVAEMRVRRFIVRDRVLVRIRPASPWGGRYWILDSIEGFDALVAALEARSR